jgi:hypothetical protein
MMAAPKGNSNAKKAKVWSDAIHKHLTQNPKDLADIAKSLVDQAKEGNIAAIEEIGDRLEGKAVQPLEGQIEQNLTVELIRYANTASE